MNQFEENLEGEGLRDMFNGAIDRLKGFYKGVRLEFPPKERALLKMYGGFEISQILICRTPIYQVLDKVLNVLSFGQWESLKQQNNFDKMFHLFMVVRLSNQHMVRIEKNEVINITNTFKLSHDTEFDDVPLKGLKITLHQLLQNAIDAVGRNQFFIYSPWKENCQRFLLDILQSNNLLDENARTFIYQDITQLVEKLPWFTKAIGQKITDTAHSLNILQEGQGFKKINKNISY